MVENHIDVVKDMFLASGNYFNYLVRIGAVRTQEVLNFWGLVYDTMFLDLLFSNY